MASSEKRCLYEVLGLNRDCTADEIRSAYKRLALQRHPDKLVQSGVSEAEATASFQELVNAYEVLSDQRERAWYDSHRNQILFSSSTATGSTSFVPDLFPFFSNSVYSGYSDSGRGFYKVYGDLFEKIYANEVNFTKKLGLPLPREAPVTAFYNYWLGFITVMDFFWADQYDAMAGPNRKSRRVMEDENKKLRKKARREYNETVRGLAEFVKKRDKRVIDMQVKRNEEMERKKEEEKQRKKELERQKAEKARNYEEQEWAKVEEVEEDEAEDMLEEKKQEFYCVACSKKFKSDKQWKNHEQSKKHKEKVAELREAFREEDEEYEATEGSEREAEEGKEVEGDGVGDLSADDRVNDLPEQFEDAVVIEGDDSDDGKTASSEVDEFAGADNHSRWKGIAAELGSDDDEASMIEAMLSRSKRTNKNQPKAPSNKTQVEMDSDDMEFMEYNDTKSSRRNRGSRRQRGRRHEEEAETMKADMPERNGDAGEQDERYDDAKESSSHPLPEPEARRRTDDATERSHKRPQQAVNKKNTAKKENASRLKAASKGRKQKGAVNGSDNNVCEKCGEQFDSRNKLHKHLGDTGHASFRSR
ncbi:UNVERIFIED_CONTAM: DNAJ protein JJJ1 [Sesamum angustifolium]|uniref:DNAJ protein JJJ1 n=1 Tax=Sesamum angustifolium TaxID=2727405 RepID=A0AAW2QAX1_9LAMI